jgi:hypothetical protein
LNRADDLGLQNRPWEAKEPIGRCRFAAQISVDPGWAVSRCASHFFCLSFISFPVKRPRAGQSHRVFEVRRHIAHTTKEHADSLF